MGHGASDVSMVCFTSDGTRLISSDVVGKTILWDMATQDPISTLRDGSTVEKGLLGLALGRSQDNIDCVLFLTPVGYSSFPLPLLPSSNSFNAATRGQPMIEEGESQTQADTQMELVNEDVSMVKKGKGSVKKTPVQEADDSFHEESINHLKSSTMGPAQFVDDALASTLEAAGDDDAEDEEPIVYAPFVLPSELQPRFQPSTTTPDDYQRRYLVWNAIGTIVSRDESAGANRIEIKFSNSTGKNKQETFPDTNKFTLAALSYEGSFFATEISPEDTSSRSVLFYHAFPNQTALEGANEDFSLTISEGEGALAVAVGRGWAAVATTRSFLRVFTSTGLQIAIITLAAGPIVSMTGNSVDTILRV